MRPVQGAEGTKNDSNTLTKLQRLLWRKTGQQILYVGTQFSSIVRAYLLNLGCAGLPSSLTV